MLDIDPPPANLPDLADRLKALAEPKRLLIPGCSHFARAVFLPKPLNKN